MKTLGPALKRVVASYLPPGSEREDLAQEVSLAVVRALPSHRGEASVRTYVLRIAHNVALRYVTRRRRAFTEPMPDQVADPGPCPEAIAARSQRQERLLSAVRRLPIAQRQVLTLALEELSHAEIAQTLGISDNAVATRLHRARERLRAELESP